VVLVVVDADLVALLSVELIPVLLVLMDMLVLMFVVLVVQVLAALLVEDLAVEENAAVLAVLISSCAFQVPIVVMVSKRFV
jgi:hypothetical protein